jgi:hypothetical protein
MGWSGGSTVMAKVIKALLEAKIDHPRRLQAYRGIIHAFEQADADTLCECLEMDSAFDQAYKEANPDQFEDEPADPPKDPQPDPDVAHIDRPRRPGQ